MKRNILRALAALVLSVGVSQAGVAFADDTRPSTVTGNPGDCRSAGLPGQILEVTATVRDNTYIDITAVPAGYQLTGAAVVLSPEEKKFSRYLWLGDLPWKDLQAPQAKPFTKWFACAKPRTQMPTPTPETTTTTPTITTTTTTSVPSSSSSAVAATTTTKAAAKPAELAETGFNGGVFVLFGAGLLVAGGAALILSRARRRS